MSVYSLSSQDTGRTRVMTLGTFHFNFPNLDVQKTKKSDQIDVLEKKYQDQIQEIADELQKFRPTVIVIERTPSQQHFTDSVFNEYRKGNYILKRGEEEQLGFRIAKQLGIDRIYCVDEWGNFTPNIEKILNEQDSASSRKFDAFLEANPDSSKKFIMPTVFKTKGIKEQLLVFNDPVNIEKSLGNYLVGGFKFESEPGDFTGVDFETGRWFSRNLKIFRNIQRIQLTKNDRILVIFGAGHLNLLNYFFHCSPEYELVSPLKYLK